MHTIRLSNNELLALLNRAFKSMGSAHDGAEDAAFSAWWLQAHGIPWLDTLPERWQRLDQAMTSKPELVAHRAADSVIDARGASMLHCCPNLIDLLYANACSESLATIEIRRCLDRTLVLSSLVVLARRGANAIARWSSDDHIHLATISAGHPFPDYILYNAPSGEDPRTGLFVACSRSDSGLDHYYRNKSRLDEAYSVEASRLAEQFEREATRSRLNGILINAASLDLLNSAADRLLVREGDRE